MKRIINKIIYIFYLLSRLISSMNRFGYLRSRNYIYICQSYDNIKLYINFIYILFFIIFISRRRQQRLEQEQADIEHEIRVIQSRPAVNRIDSDKVTIDKHHYTPVYIYIRYVIYVYIYVYCYKYLVILNILTGNTFYTWHKNINRRQINVISIEDLFFFSMFFLTFVLVASLSVNGIILVVVIFFFNKL